MSRGGFVPVCAMCAQGFCMEHYHVDPATSCASGSPPEQNYEYVRAVIDEANKRHDARETGRVRT